MAEVVVKQRGIITFGIGLLAALAGGWLVVPRAIYRSTEQPIQFSHKIHTSEKVGLSCQDCHSLNADGKFSGIPRLETCAPCHTERQGKTAAEKLLVDDYVSKNREIPWLVYARQPENVYFSHAPHIKLAGIKCERCHGPHGTTDRLRPYEQNRISTYARDVEGYSLVRLQTADWEHGMKMNECSHCHQQRGVQESCLTCHK
jgi:menaquinone reductase, multiheme cytochrome c subunit